jgi:Tfp pilus assembly protein PilN
MRAVNLIPADQRRGAGPGPSTLTYGVLGGLAVIVIALTVYVLTVNTVNSRRGELARVGQQSAALERRAAALRPYQDFATLRQARSLTVAALTASRFDWQRVMDDVARALPGDVWLTSVVGTIAPGVAVRGGVSATDTAQLRSAVQSPAVEIVGCTDNQSEVARIMSRLRVLHGVTRVSLASSEKATAGAGGSANGASSSDCRNGNQRFPEFQLVVFFQSPTGASLEGGVKATAPTTPTAVAPTTPAAVSGAASQQPAATSGGAR